jgi:hypothetical protein
VEQLRNIGIINSTTRLHLVGSFYEIYITMHGSMKIKIIGYFTKLYKLDEEGKAIPLHSWTGPEGSRRLRLPDFKTIGT